ncbi:MAG: hypothetical protein WA635_05945, partial [Gallionella sp.]
MLHMRAGISCCVRHAFSQVFSVAIIFASLSTQPAHALIIGEIEVISRVGEPLLAYVPITPEGPDERITTACFSLIKSGISPTQEKANLSAARLELEGNRNIGLQVRISTTAPVNSRSLKLQLKAKCVSNGLVIREFFFELAPAASPILPPINTYSTPSDKVDSSTSTRTASNSALQKPELNGSVRVGYFSSSRKLDEQTDLATGSVWLSADQNFGEDTSLFAQGWIRNDESFKASGASNKLLEAYLNFSSENTDYRIGKQIIVWGRADRLNPTDNLTPRDFTLLTPEDDDQRAGTLAAKMTYHSQANSLTG